MRRIVSAATNAALRWARTAWQLFPFSVAGLVTALVAAFLWVKYGREESDFVAQTAAVVMLAVVAASVLTTCVASLVLFLTTRTRARAHVEGDVDAGTELRTGFDIPSLRWWPMVKITLRWRTPVDAQVSLEEHRGRAQERVVLNGRGRFDRVERLFEIRDIFGLASIGFRLSAPANLRVAPAPCRASLALALRHASGEGYAHPAGEAEGDRVEMRRYAPGDPLRMILWRAYARSRRLLVRVPERAIAPKPSALAYFVAGPADEPTASAARLFIESGLLGADFRFSADGVDHAATTHDEALEHVIDSAHHGAEGGAGLAQLLTRHDRAELSNCVFFVPGEDGPWIDNVMQAARALPAPPTVVLAVDGEVESRRTGRLRRWLVQADEAAPDDLAGLPALYDRLASLGGPVHVIHRPTGEALANLQIERLRA